MRKIPKKVLFCVYGTLKAEYGNNRLLREDGVEFKGDFITEPNFTMVSCGGFPAVYCDGNTAIKCELYEVTNQAVIDRVYGLEGYSGVRGNEKNWYDVEEIDTKYGKASMFVFRGEHNNKNIVKNGNW